MAWYDHAQNPEAIRSLFSGGEDLGDVSLSSVELERDGPAIRLRFDLEQFPDSPPATWRGQGFNRAQVTVAFFAVRTCAITGWSRTNLCRVEIVPGEEHHRVHVYGPGCEIAFTADAFRIDEVSGYLSADGRSS